MNEHHIPWAAQTAAPFRLTDESQLDKLKNELLRQAIASAPDSDRILVLRRAANEAAALAWLEPFPLLAFPELFHEKVRATRRIQSKQAQIRARSTQILSKAA
jgi:hypothetical protein